MRLHLAFERKTERFFLRLNGLGLAIEHCIDRLSEQADLLCQHVRSEVAYV